MARDSSKYRGMCPFWSLQTMKCQLHREGLFIPLNDHIEVYCKTLHYPQCQQFSLHSANHLQPTEKERQERRKYDRVATIHRLTLVELVQTGQFASHHATAHATSNRGKTLDLSKGGMRLTTEQPLAKAALVRFTFQNSFLKSVESGQGQIVWCNKQENSDHQAGIAFEDDRLIDIMGLYLGLITSIPPSSG